MGNTEAKPQPVRCAPMFAPDGETPSRFFVVGDWGDIRASPAVAKAMADRASQQPIEFVVSVGDHFYGSPLRGVSDRKFRTHWYDVFLRDYEQLRVPWYLCLGNHDYDEGCDPDAQVNFTNHQANVEMGGFWNCPAKCYNFCKQLPSGGKMEFFAVDTNACQSGPRQRESQRLGRDSLCDLQDNLHELDAELSASTADWKFVFGHHPLYNNGFRPECDFLRNSTGLERSLRENDVTAYFAGHEHVLQHHEFYSIDHYGVGTTGACYQGYFNGKNTEDWLVQSGWDATKAGFLEVSVTSKCMQALFISEQGSVLHEVIRCKEKVLVGNDNVHDDCGFAKASTKNRPRCQKQQTENRHRRQRRQTEQNSS